MPYRIQSVMENTILMAIPLFIFMGVVLQKTRLAEQLLIAMAQLFGRINGGIAISTILVGALLAASTGVVGASVVAVAPGVLLIALYIGYILFITARNPEKAPALPASPESTAVQFKQAVVAIIPPLALMLVVLGSIFSGIATPTESSALGGVGAIILAVCYRQFATKMLWESANETVKVTAMVFAILIGATAFSMTFSYSGGDHILEQWLMNLPGEKWGFLILSMLVILVLGFFIDFVEISFIIIPLLAPVAEALGISMAWFAILIAMNLQTSFLTPPLCFSLQIFVLFLLLIKPSWFGF